MATEIQMYPASVRLDARIDAGDVGADTITNPKLANMTEATIKGRASGAGTGDPTDLTPGQVRTILNVEDGATADMTGAEIAAAYEGVADRNAFTDAEKAKLADLPASAGLAAQVEALAQPYVDQAEQAAADAEATIADLTEQVASYYGAAANHIAVTNGTLSANATALVAVATTGGPLMEIDIAFETIGSGSVSFNVVNNPLTSRSVVGNHALPSLTKVGRRIWDAAEFDAITLTAGQGIEIVSPSGGPTAMQRSATGATLRYITPASTSGSTAYTTVANTELQGRIGVGSAEVQVSTEALEPALAEQLDFVGELVSTVTETGGYDIGSSTAEIGGNYMLALGDGDYAPFTSDGRLSLVFPTGAIGGTFGIAIMNPNGGNSWTTETYLGPFTATASTDKTLTNADLDDIVVREGQMAAWVLTTGQATLRRVLDSSLTGRFVGTTAVGGTKSFSSAASTAYGGIWSLERDVSAVPLEALSEDLQETLNSLPDAIDSLDAISRAVIRPKQTFETYFGSSAPAGWTFVGSWTHPSGGAKTPVGAGTGGGLVQYAYVTDRYATVDEMRRIAYIYTPDATGTVFYIGTTNAISPYATLFKVDHSTNTLGVCGGGGTWASLPSTIATASMAAETAGRAYLIELEVDRRVVSCTITDLVTGGVLGTISYGAQTTTSLNAAGLLRGADFIANVVGQTTFQEVRTTSAIGNPRALAICDSRGAMSYYSITEAQRWAALVRARLGGSFVMLGVDGGSAGNYGAGDLVTQILAHELPRLAPKFVLYGLGTNDGNVVGTGVANNSTKIDAVLAWCDANDAELGLMLPWDNTGVASYSNQRSMMLAKPARVRKIRTDLALTVNNDGTTFDTANFGDALHPSTPAAHIAIYNRIAVDWPEFLQ